MAPRWARTCATTLTIAFFATFARGQDAGAALDPTRQAALASETRLLGGNDDEINDLLGGTDHSDAANEFLFDDSIHYKIHWAGPKPTDLVKDENSLFVRTDGGKYVCQLPSVIRRPNSLKDDKQFDKNILAAYTLLRKIFASVCSYRLEPYWTYELCHGRYVRQYHEEKSKQEYMLGTFDADVQLESAVREFTQRVSAAGRWPTVAVDETQLPYIELNMTGGTVCDLNGGKPRLTRAMYVCGEEAKHELYSLKETSTCEYEAIVLSPLMCAIDSFRTRGKDRENGIHCYALDNSPTTPPNLVSKAPKSLSLEDLLGSDLVERLKDGGAQIIETMHSGQIGGENVDIQFKVIQVNPGAEGLDLSVIDELPGQKRVRPMQVPASESVSDEGMVRDFLAGRLCFTGSSGYWKYELCYGKQVKQFHEERGVRGASITLGRWDAARHNDWLAANPTRNPPAQKTPKSVSHLYDGGDVCDVSGKPRRVEVVFRCKFDEKNPSAVSLYLVEPRTCDYLLKVEAAFICPLLNEVDEGGLFVVKK